VGSPSYDQDRVYDSVTERHPEAVIIVPPRANAVPSDTAETAPTQRDRHLQQIAKHGRMSWQTSSGYTKRAKAETGMSGFKQVIGDGLRSHTGERQRTEVEVAVHVLIRMGSVKNLGHYAASWSAWWPKRPSSTAALT